MKKNDDPQIDAAVASSTQSSAPNAPCCEPSFVEKTRRSGATLRVTTRDPRVCGTARSQP